MNAHRRNAEATARPPVVFLTEMTTNHAEKHSRVGKMLIGRALQLQVHPLTNEITALHMKIPPEPKIGERCGLGRGVLEHLEIHRLLARGHAVNLLRGPNPLGL